MIDLDCDFMICFGCSESRAPKHFSGITLVASYESMIATQREREREREKERERLIDRQTQGICVDVVGVAKAYCHDLSWNGL
jgi:hypothetical protein